MCTDNCTPLLSVKKPEESIKTPQGGYCDKEYYYQIFIQKDFASNEENNIDRIVKTEIATGRVVMTSPPLALNHANDMTYNARIDKFIVCHNNPNRHLISFLDPETLTVTDTLSLPCLIFSIDYNEDRNMYVVGLAGGQSFRFLDKNFRFADDTVHLPTEITKGYITQGVGCDNRYIYFVLFRQNVITVYDWDGNFVTVFDAHVNGHEPENISIADGTVYVGSGGGDGSILWEILPPEGLM
ncbi:MAG: hypothetical protein E7658_00135 [Ruminococcaceae bacterium]|nr:hypothetical protein [Oscillospiraceae bacterium]